MKTTICSVLHAAAIACLLVACVKDDPAPTINLNCVREQGDTGIEQICANGDDDHSKGDDGSGGAEGAEGEGGAAEVLPKYFFCYSWPPYAGGGKPCAAVADCPAASSPCEIVQCDSNEGMCGIAWWGDGSPVCGDPGMTCIGSYCCGEDNDPN